MNRCNSKCMIMISFRCVSQNIATNLLINPLQSLCHFVHCCYISLGYHREDLTTFIKTTYTLQSLYHLVYCCCISLGWNPYFIVHSENCVYLMNESESDHHMHYYLPALTSYFNEGGCTHPVLF